MAKKEAQTVAAKAKFESRKLMELAIEIMRQSVPEPRDDGKASPKVGAVLVKPDGAVEIFEKKIQAELTKIWGKET
ncbi:MAG: hypothetical protein Q7J06_00360 [Bacteroidales bacterium]|nr:hypothetical protein [Bacteroidales bacterium]